MCRCEGFPQKGQVGQWHRNSVPDILFASVFPVSDFKKFVLVPIKALHGYNGSFEIKALHGYNGSFEDSSMMFLTSQQNRYDGLSHSCELLQTRTEGT
ncbi:hypothetical protein NECAME_13960 [Necator americanus]|uniref:Uncharacterized protein n=1 Tax=Necator americanus TaxID=51031 RepID=W2SRK0_NECAM|nr:hypothetical protein NECAME_13960 [Necator americanus]ETN72153.1 hypothetical protein NECAME_13960 [Necator americanus]